VRFLIVDDHAPDRRRVTRVASEHHLDEASSLGEALELVDASEEPVGQYDAILLDLDLPDSTGAETYYRMRQRVAPVPIVIYSRNEDLELAKALHRDGAAEYILKRVGLRGEVVLRILEIATFRERHPQGAAWDLARLLETAQDSSRRVRHAISDAPPSVREVVEGRIAELEEKLRELVEANARLAHENEAQDADITANRLRALSVQEAAQNLAARHTELERKVSEFSDLPKEERNRVRVKHGVAAGGGVILLQLLALLLREVLLPVLLGGGP